MEQLRLSRDTTGQIYSAGDALLVTSHEARPDGGTAPALALFSFGGQRLGEYLPVEGYGDARNSSVPRDMRLIRTGETTYALYDPHHAVVRRLRATPSGSSVTISQTTAPTIALPTAGGKTVAFDSRPDGRVVVARTLLMPDHRGRSVVDIFDTGGKLVEEIDTGRLWHYAYAADSLVRGFSAQQNDNAMLIHDVIVH